MSGFADMNASAASCVSRIRESLPQVETRNVTASPESDPDWP